jgi:hypothetical protein
MEDTEISKKNAKKLCCEYCDFSCCKVSDIERHKLRPKHIKNEKRYKMIQKNAELEKNTLEDEYCCTCGRTYKYSSGLWRHKKHCKEEEEEDIMKLLTPQTKLTPELIIKLIEQNKDLQQTLIDQNKIIVELAQKAGNTNTINGNVSSNSNSNNKTFNLQVFLNETCKDAINMTDFVDQIQVSLSELEETGTLGYAEGISKVFIKNLNDINYSERPIHCSDSKRETIYIKDDNQWIKDDENKTKLTRAIKQVANKNIKKITKWQQKYPDYKDPTSKRNDKYMKIVLNSMSGSTKEESDKNYEKIAKNITKKVVINKSVV